MLQFFKEMLQIVPVVFLLTGLIAVWLPPALVLRHLGNSSGWQGKGLSLLVGAFSAGPIYAAFPLAQTLLQKGASISNVVIIISAWAVIKVPLVLAEARFLGAGFALARNTLTLPAILLIGMLTEKVVRQVTVDEQARKFLFPGHNCGACGYASCEQLAQLCHIGEATPDQCVLLKRQATSQNG